MIHFSFELTNAMNDMIALGATDEQINEIFNIKIKNRSQICCRLIRHMRKSA